MVQCSCVIYTHLSVRLSECRVVYINTNRAVLMATNEMVALQVIGFVTRKDLARYRFESHKGSQGLEELQMSFN